MTEQLIRITIMAVKSGVVEYRRDDKPGAGTKSFSGLTPDSLRPKDRAFLVLGDNGQPREIRHQKEPPEGRKVEAPRPVTPTNRVPAPTTDRGFVNPYTMLARTRINSDNPGWAAWGDHAPAGHERLADDHLRGFVNVTMTAESPLLLLDQSESVQGSALGLRRGPDGQPLLDPTAIKGVLRTAFEAVTVSRFGVFAGHDTPLALRADASSALDLLPARVTGLADSRDGRTAARIEVITSLDHPRRPVGSEPPRDVWVPAYGHWQLSGLNHGRHVRAWIHLVKHSAERQASFLCWRASALGDAGNNLKPGKVQVGGPWSEVAGVEAILVEGYLVVGGRSFSRKHDERLHVTSVLEGDLALTVATVESAEAPVWWRAVLDSYNAATPEPVTRGSVVSGRHVRRYAAERELGMGTLGFARLDKAGKLTGLFPVMIGREPFSHSPEQLLESALRTPNSLEEFSPAERLFGWVGGKRARRGRGVAAYRGHVWIEDIDAAEVSAEDLTSWDPDGLQLSTLNEPKPAQYRFYLRDGKGNPLPVGTRKQVNEGYRDGRSIPRKFYWPHSVPKGYWERPMELKPHRGKDGPEGYVATPLGPRFREYIAPPGTKPTVSRRIKEWVSPGATFTFTVRFDGVERESLGMVLWLLTNPELRFGLGGGKPLGFGTVRLSIDPDRPGEIHSGASVRSTLSSWSSTGTEATISDLVQQATDSLEAAYPGHLRRFEALSKSPKSPVHYPRLGPEPTAESYEWFVANDKAHGRKFTLPDLEKPALDYDPTSPPQTRARQQRR